MKRWTNLKKKKKSQKRLNGQWKLRKEEKEREKKTTRGGKGMHSVKYGANKKNKVYGG
jgi:hypothetical protein